MEEPKTLKQVWKLLLGGLGQAVKAFQSEEVDIEKLKRVEDEIVAIFQREEIPEPFACAILADFIACIEDTLVRSEMANLKKDIDIYHLFLNDVLREDYIQ